MNIKLSALCNVVGRNLKKTLKSSKVAGVETKAHSSRVSPAAVGGGKQKWVK